MQNIEANQEANQKAIEKKPASTAANQNPFHSSGTRTLHVLHVCCHHKHARPLQVKQKE
jgi:hypothetical protein